MKKKSKYNSWGFKEKGKLQELLWLRYFKKWNMIDLQEYFDCTREQMIYQFRKHGGGYVRGENDIEKNKKKQQVYKKTPKPEQIEGRNQGKTYADYLKDGK